MARLIDFGGEVNSNLVQGLGTNSATFTMPGNIGLAVESVLATIDNSAGGVATATLTVKDQSGEVIAKKRLGDTIPAADTGTATWALRLADSSTGGNGIQYDVQNVGDWLSVETTGDHFGRGMEFDCDSGDFAVFQPQSGPGEMQLQGYDFRWEGPNGGFRVREDGHINLNGASDLFVSMGAGIQQNAHDFNTNLTTDSQHFCGGDFLVDAVQLDCDAEFAQHGGKVSFELPTGTTFELKDHTGAVKWRWTEGTTVLHGPTGGSIVFDL